jgi:hypothetical protein
VVFSENFPPDEVVRDYTFTSRKGWNREDEDRRIYLAGEHCRETSTEALGRAGEVAELFANTPHIRFAEKGKRKGEDLYAGFGQTDAGRGSVLIWC